MRLFYLTKRKYKNTVTQEVNDDITKHHNYTNHNTLQAETMAESETARQVLREIGPQSKDKQC